MRVPLKAPIKLIFFGFWFFISKIQGQSNLLLDNYDHTDGLSQSSVNTIVSDKKGAIWAGTQDGLNEFDGYEFRAITKENHRELKNSYFQSSDKDGLGNLWFTTKKELLYYDAEKGRFNSFLNLKDLYPILQIVCTWDGVYTLHKDGQLFLFNAKNRRFTKINLRQGIKQLVKSEASPFAVTYDNSIYKLQNPSRPEWIYSSKGLEIYSAYEANKNLFLFLKGKVELLYHGQIRKSISFIHWDTKFNSSVSGIVPGGDGYFVATKGNGLFVLLGNGKLEHFVKDYFQPKGLLSNTIYTLHKDAQNVIWIGTDKGLSCYAPSQNNWNQYGPSSIPARGLPSENVWSFWGDMNYLWIGRDNGLSCFDKQKRSFIHFDKRNQSYLEKDGSVMDIQSLSKEVLLLACFDGLFTFNISNGQFKQINLNPSNPNHKHINCYSLLSLNDRILVTTNSGVLILNKSSLVIQELYYDPESVFRDLFKDSQGLLWCISDKGGLYIIDRNTFALKSTPYSKRIQQLTNDPLSCMIEADQDQILIGTHGAGILQVNKKTHEIRLINTINGLPNNVVLGMAKDAQGKIWVSTNSGLAFILSGTNRVSTVTNFDSDEVEFNSNAIYKDADGTICAGGTFGFLFLDPKEKQNQIPVFFPKISKVVLKKKNSEWPLRIIGAADLSNNAFRITLPYHARDFEIWFQPNSLYQSKQMEYKCEMIGETTDTIYLGHTNHISFNSLASGTYYLRIYSRKGKHGVWTETPALLTVIIQPPFWASKPFLGTSFVLFIFSGFVVVRLRIRKEQKEKMALEQLVQERTKEIQQQRDEIEEKNVRINEEKNKVLQQQQLLYKEKEVAEKWLSNALPEQAIKELQRLGKVKAKSFEAATILFTDLVGFSKTSESMSPARLVNKLDSLVRKFDSIIKDSKIEKIKTIGDAYMAVGGIPERNTTHPIDVCLAALKIKEFMLKLKYEALANGKDFWEIRMGINTGPVTAGVIGRLKIAYDVWGAAVNQAQRMERNAEPGTISISESTFLLVEPYFEFIHKGKAAMKTKTRINRYELVRIKPDLSIRGEGILPNDLFYEIQQLHLFSPIKYYSVELEVLKMLEEQLPQNLYYHCAEHTREVIHAVEHLALSEGVRDEGLFLLKTAALFHDLGFTKQYEQNESIGVEFATQILPKFGYSDLHINTVAELIFATEVPHKPVNKLQEIICDADLDYLGTDNFEEISKKLKLELMEKGKIASDRQWDEMQIPFLQNHRYYTETAILTRAPKKQENLERVMARLEANAYP